ncbi:hypothetical protein [Vampirovibrio chlorellavorus]|uniref:hypothetical protein n=1 Tax=Vampirovibrio chlorellavorus TaxID=758823 RepID=UPI0026F365B8|nr:hypothetical protein [Vampirovibrio chlorellavorus]
MISLRSRAVDTATPQNFGQHLNNPAFTGKSPSAGRKAQPPRQTALEQMGMLMTIPILLGVNGLSYLAGLEEPQAVWVTSDAARRLDLWA